MTTSMMRGFLALCAILAVTTVLAPAAGAAQVISVGAEYGFLLPNPPYTPDTLRIQITLGYGEPENTIGEQVWIMGPGVYDLSGDPDMGCFLNMASDGIPEFLSVAIFDAAGASISCPDALGEPQTLGVEPWTVDLNGLDATGIQLSVWDLSLAGGCIVHWEVTGLPEPATLLSAIPLALVLVRVWEPRCW
ncbi:MAG TPA: hypothetical protein PLL20_19615 [Phycisphaerae bacterium]|nr:hypothetical protein [Phycisphaerae bacterium]HRR86274.1 hypothetical protein [Phycisphaerae bacterium]